MSSIARRIHCVRRSILHYLPGIEEHPLATDPWEFMLNQEILNLGVFGKDFLQKLPESRECPTADFPGHKGAALRSPGASPGMSCRKRDWPKQLFRSPFSTTRGSLTVRMMPSAYLVRSIMRSVIFLNSVMSENVITTPSMMFLAVR